MKILALETSTLLGSVAVIVDGQVVAQESSMRQNSHSEIINIFVDKCLKAAGLSLSEIDLFATGQGPGSFTGIRVAANAAKSFAFAFNKPLVSIDTLSLLALQAEASNRPILAIVNAYKNMVYTGLFKERENGLACMLGPEAISVRDLAAHITEEVLVVGDGFLDYEKYFPERLLKYLHRDTQYPDYPLAATLGLHAESKSKNKNLNWKNYFPLYIRSSEAEENKKGLLIKPLI